LVLIFDLTKKWSSGFKVLEKIRKKYVLNHKSILKLFAGKEMTYGTISDTAGTSTRTIYVGIRTGTE
jgi:hypothetical protein